MIVIEVYVIEEEDMAILDWDNFERIHGGVGGAWKAFENVCFELVRKKYGKESNVKKVRPFTVSYTHLTLPTIGG